MALGTCNWDGAEVELSREYCAAKLHKVHCQKLGKVLKYDFQTNCLGEVYSSAPISTPSTETKLDAN